MGAISLTACWFKFKGPPAPGVQVCFSLPHDLGAIERGAPTFALRDTPLAGHSNLPVARIDTPPLLPAALAFVSYG